MRLLVTNTHTPQAYAIIRALRPHASRVVATLEGPGLRARVSHAARSRLVDARHDVPSAVDDWAEGLVSEVTSDRERRYIEAIEDVCRRERIDTIYPSWDPYVYVLSKHKRRFEQLGVTIPVPDFSTVLTALDKHRTIEAARLAGFAVPHTWLYESMDQARRIAREAGFPLVIKPRFTSGSRGMAIVHDQAALDAALPEIVSKHGGPLIQEYIPGGRRDSAQFVLGRDGAVLFAFHKRRLRTFRRTARLGAVSESASPDERLVQSATLLRHLGWWGAMGIETMFDPRDGTRKLMEVNPRFPRQLWNRTELGINEPLMCVRMARGERVEPAPAYPHGVLFVCPIEDVQLFALQLIDLLAYRVRTGVLGRPPIDPLIVPLSLVAQTRSFLGTYDRRRQRVWGPYWRYALRDPLVSALWCVQFSTWILGALKQVGR